MSAPKGDEVGRALTERAEELARRERQSIAELEEIRATIARLRSEREAKIAEFRALTRPGSRAAPGSPAAPHDDRARDAAPPAPEPAAAPPLLIAPREVPVLEEAPQPRPSATPPDETVAPIPIVPGLSGPPAVPLDLPELPEFVNTPSGLPSLFEPGDVVAVEPPASPIGPAALVEVSPVVAAPAPQHVDEIPVAEAPPAEAVPLPSPAPAAVAALEADIDVDAEDDAEQAAVDRDLEAPVDVAGIHAEPAAPAKLVAPRKAIPAEPSPPADITVPSRRFRVRPPRIRWTVSRQSLTVAAVAVTGLVVASIALWSPWSRTPQGPGQVVSPRQPAPGDTLAVDPAAGARPSSPEIPEARPREPLRALNVLLVTSRPVWIRAVVDGRILLNDTVAAGENIALAGNTTVTVRLGDAGAVGVWLNGESLGRAGRNGEVLTRRFDAGSQSVGRPPNP